MKLVMKQTKKLTQHNRALSRGGAVSNDGIGAPNAKTSNRRTSNRGRGSARPKAKYAPPEASTRTQSYTR